MLFHYLPEQTRLSAMHGIYKGSKFFAGPAAGWWVKERIQKNVSVSLACICEKAQVRNGRVHLQIASSDGGRSEVSTDHVIAATGFRVDLRRLRFLCEQVRSQVRTLQGAPVLSANFESSVPGLYFVGLASTNDFGPTMRFMCGAGYTAKRMSEHLARVARTEIHAA